MWTISFIIVLFSLLIVKPVIGQQLENPGCVKRPGIADNLFNNYSEVPRAMGLSSGGGMMELWVSESGSWTITFTTPRGCIFIVEVGHYLEILPDANFKKEMST